MSLSDYNQAVNMKKDMQAVSYRAHIMAAYLKAHDVDRRLLTLAFPRLIEELLARRETNDGRLDSDIPF